MPHADARARLPASGAEGTDGVATAVIAGELGHAGAGTVELEAPRVAARLAWLRRFVGVQADARAIAALDGVRCIAASLVFMVHYQAAFGPLLAARPALSEAGRYAADVGYHGVNLFFVLSGFLIYGSLVGRPVPLRVYLWRRVRRIYPTFLAVLGLYLTVGRAIMSRDKLPSEGTVVYVLQNVLLLPGVFDIKPIITVAWSLSYEIFFYLGIAAVVVLLGLRRWESRQRAALFVALLAAWALGGPAVHRAVGSFVMFVPGIVLWELTRSPRVDAIRQRTGPWLVWGSFVAALLVLPALQRPAVAVPLERVGIAAATATVAVLSLVVPLLLVNALGRQSAVARVLGWEPLRVVGVMSYSFYLIHGVAINLVALLFWRVMGESPAHGPLLYLAMLPVVYGAAVLTSLVLFRTVEEPLSL